MFWKPYDSMKRKCLFFQKLKFFQQGNDCVFGFCQKTTKTQSMYLAFKTSKISNKNGQQ